MTGKRLAEELRQRFGLPEDLFRRLALVEHKEDVFIATPEVDDFDRIKPVRKGIRLARIFPHGFKPTTNAMQLFGRCATRNVVELDRDGARAFMSGEDLPCPASPGVTEGFVIVRHDELALGVGLLKQGVLKSQVPGSRRATGS